MKMGRFSFQVEVSIEQLRRHNLARLCVPKGLAKTEGQFYTSEGYWRWYNYSDSAANIAAIASAYAYAVRRYQW